MTNLPKLKVNRGNIGNELWVSLPNLDGAEKTFLSGDEALGQTTIGVLSGKNFAADDYVLIGMPGTETCELRKASAQTDTTITTDAFDFAHPKGTLVTVIPFNQVEISSATAIGGSYSVAATIAIKPDALETYHNIEGDASTKAYKVRFKNSTDTTYSDYSDEITGAGYADNTVYAIKKRALDQLGEKIEGVLTDEYLNESLWQARREVHSLVKRWSWRTSFDSVLAVVAAGAWSASSPSTLEKPDSPENIIQIRIGAEGIPVTYLPKIEFDRYYSGVKHATVGSAITSADTTAVLDSVYGSGDFDEAGSAKVGTDDITYTANNEGTETLSGIPASSTGSFASSHAVGVDVWQDVSYGLPRFYTIHGGNIYFNVPFHNDYADENVHIDFYRTLIEYNSDADVLDEPEYDMYVHYLKAMIRQKKSKGKIKLDSDSDYQTYLKKAALLVKKDMTNQTVQFVPEIERLNDAE